MLGGQSAVVVGGEGGDCTVGVARRVLEERVVPVSGCFRGMGGLERALLQDLSSTCLDPLSLSLPFPLLPLPHLPGHGLPGKPVRGGGAGHQAPGAGHAELPAETPRARPGPAPRHGLRRQAPGPPQLPDCCLGQTQRLMPPQKKPPNQSHLPS